LSSSSSHGGTPNFSSQFSTETPGKPTVKRIVDFLKNSATTEDQIKGINKRMQRVVEETLTKNMHLQENLELLSNEVVVLKAQLRAMITASPK
jgi:hypothetical protein